MVKRIDKITDMTVNLNNFCIFTKNRNINLLISHIEVTRWLKNIMRKVSIWRERLENETKIVLELRLILSSLMYRYAWIIRYDRLFHLKTNFENNKKIGLV